MNPSPFSLALGGWAARGLAHIGVIKRLEELGMSPVAIAGTSMGAIIGTLLALGSTSDEMRTIIANIAWMKLIDIDLKKWLLKWQKIEKFLDTIFEGKSFSDTQIPLTMIATDIHTSDNIVLREWNLAQAVRASISIPWIFMPKTLWGRELVDGILTNNLPIEHLPPGFVIASSALRDLKRPIKYKRRVWGIEWQKTIIGNAYSYTQKVIDIVSHQNEARSVWSRKDVLYIISEFDQLDYLDFLSYDQFIAAGYRASEVIIGCRD